MNDAITQLVARWSTADGLPFKGQLIATDGCMCAQGQALHYIGGYTADQLRAIDQSKADKETARLLGISVSHAVLLRNTNDSIDGAPSIVLTHPEKVLGDQAKIVLAFWMHLDQMSPAAGVAAGAAVGAAAGDAAWYAAWYAAGVAAGAAAGVAAGVAAGAAAGAAARYAAGAAAGASIEIQGAALMRERCQPFFFLPLFGFENPDEIMEQR